jgi:hypothetical protein
MRNTGLHLTNYSLNKMAAEFVPNTEPDDDSASSKRSISTAFRQLREAYGAKFDEESVWEEISEVVGKTLACIAPILMTVAGRAGGDGSGNADGDSYLPKCFHLLGFDIFLDDAFACHLFEINHHPSLLSEAPVDLFVKRAVLEPLFAMVAFDSASCRRNRARQRRRRAAQRKQRGGDDDDSDSTEPDDDDESASDADEDPRVAWEVQHAGPAYIACVDAESEFEQFIRPFDALRTIFVQACGIGAFDFLSRCLAFCRGFSCAHVHVAQLSF